MHIETFFDQATDTFTHVVHDQATKKAAIIDAVLNYDQFSGRVSTESADTVLDYIRAQDLIVDWVLDTHIHADHITAAHYLQSRVGGHIGIGEKIQDVLAYWVPIFNTAHDTKLDATQFDRLFKDGDVFQIGHLQVKVMHTPGHTHACLCYLIEDALFVGDTIFMPDVGTARTDFPGGDAESMYDSIQKILALPDETRLFMCHDYPPEGSRPVAFMTTVAEQKQRNVMVHTGIAKQEYVSMRHQRDAGKAVPRMLMPSIQTNLRAGHFGQAEDNGRQYVKVPVSGDDL